MKRCLVTFLVLLAVVIMFSACSSTPQAKQLNISSIKEDISIYSISVIANKNIDDDGLGKAYIEKFCSNYINDIKDMLHNKGININLDNFIKEYNSSDIKFEEMKITPSFVLNRYVWTSQNKENIRIELTLSLVITEDGTMPLSYVIKKDDPNYEPGYRAEGLIKLKFDTKF